MQRLLGWLVLVAIMCLPVGLLAQTGSLIAYSWEAGDLALLVPEAWDDPVSLEQDGRLVLQLAQSLATSPDTRPPGVPFITLTLSMTEPPETDVSAVLRAALQAVGIVPADNTEAQLAGAAALAASGVSEDGLLFGLGRAARLANGDLLVVLGRAPEAQRAVFSETFNAVANSVIQGANLTPIRPTYGVVWYTIRTAADGPGTWVSLYGAVYGPDNRLYIADANLGLLQVDAANGAVLAVFPNERLIAPAALAVDSQQRVYVADTQCRCILTFQNSQWRDEIGGFSPYSPASIAVGPDDTLYATDQGDDGVTLRVFRDSAEIMIPFGADVPDQPLLAADRGGRLLALTLDNQVLVLDGEQFVLLAQLDLPGVLVNDVAVDQNNNLVLATDSLGVLVVSLSGELQNTVGFIVANAPLPGELVSPRGVTVGPDGTLYIVDSDNTFGSITAMSTRVQAGRIGATTIAPGSTVQGLLTRSEPQQEWILNGVAGQQVTISAVDTSGTGALDLSLRLVAPDGSEEAFNDNNDFLTLPGVFDPQIADHILGANGAYTIRVEATAGDGSYLLGVTQEQTFELLPTGATQLRGTLTLVLPVQRWKFQGQARQVLTVTMQARAGTLDPLLRLFDPDGGLLAENDDAADTALGRDAQLAQVLLPTSGEYTIEARRFDGEGDYALTIVVTSP